LIIKMT